MTYRGVSALREGPDPRRLRVVETIRELLARLRGITIDVTTRHTGAQDGDAALVARMRQGDRNACAELFRRHQATVFRFARQMSGSREMAEDITQDVFVTLMHQADRFDPRRASLTTYLYGISRNLARRRLSRRSGRRTVDLDDVDDGLTPALVVEPRRLSEALRALADDDRSLNVSAETAQAVMARWDAEHRARAKPTNWLRSRSGRTVSWISAAAAAAALAVAVGSMRRPTEPATVPPVERARVASGRLPVADGADYDVFFPLGPITPRELDGSSLQRMRVQLRGAMLSRLGVAVDDVRASEVIRSGCPFR